MLILLRGSKQCEGARVAVLYLHQNQRLVTTPRPVICYGCAHLDEEERKPGPGLPPSEGRGTGMGEDEEDKPADYTLQKRQER